MAKTTTRRKRPAGRNARAKPITDEAIAAALARHHGIVSAAAKALGQTRQWLEYRLKTNPALAAVQGEARTVSVELAEAVLTRASRRNWRAASWYLSRRDPERWGTRVRVDDGAEVERLRRVNEDLMRRLNAGRDELAAARFAAEVGDDDGL